MIARAVFQAGSRSRERRIHIFTFFVRKCCQNVDVFGDLWPCDLFHVGEQTSVEGEAEKGYGYSKSSEWQI